MENAHNTPSDWTVSRFCSFRQFKRFYAAFFIRRGGRAVECGGLENRWREKRPGVRIPFPSPYLGVAELEFAWDLKSQGVIRAGSSPVAETTHGGNQCNQMTIHSIITTAVIFSKSTTKVKSKSYFPNTILWRHIQCQNPQARQHRRLKPSISPILRSFPIFRRNIQTKPPDKTPPTVGCLDGYAQSVVAFIRLSRPCAIIVEAILILGKSCLRAGLLRLGILRPLRPQIPLKQLPNLICNLKRLWKLNFRAAFNFIFKNPLTKQQICDII